MIFMFALAFLCGSLPFSVWLGELLLHRDVRHYGDSNPGAANVFRAVSNWVGLLMLVLDISKAAAPVGWAYFSLGHRGLPMFLIAVAPILGHAFSPFLGFRGGKASAATVREIRAPCVLAAGDARRTFTRLLTPEAVPVSFLKKLLKAETSHTAFNVFLGLDLPVERLNLQGCGHLFYAPDLDGITESDRLQRADYFSHVPRELSVPCLDRADLAPPRKTGLILSAMTSSQYAGHWGIVNGQPTERYERLQARCAQQMVASLEPFIPNLSQHIELCFTGTPYTLQTRTLNSEGAIMGWSYNRQKTFYRGSFLQMAKAVLTPIPNLLMAGHWSFSPGGSPVAVLTAKLAADRILKAG